MEQRNYYLTKSGNLQQTPENAYRINSGELLQLLNHVCHDSIYAYEEEMKKGYLTLPGGHRFGIVGQTVTENNHIHSVKNISSVNIRISHQTIGAADGILKYLYSGKSVKNTCIVSPPGCGKTTLLRDLVRQISNGTKYQEPQNVCIVDERSEIAGCYMGVAQNDVGLHTDVLDACPKAEGMMLVLRSMAPDVIAVDEIGRMEDIAAIRETACCGCSLLATAHANSIQELLHRPFVGDCLKEAMFEVLILLSAKQGAGTIEAIYRYEEGGYVRV